MPRKAVYQATLTPRETDVLKLLVDSHSNEETALVLSLSRRTVEAHRARIMLKLGVQDLAGLTKYAIRCGLTTF